MRETYGRAVIQRDLCLSKKREGHTQILKDDHMKKDRGPYANPGESV
jgi:hypothetical protein